MWTLSFAVALSTHLGLSGDYNKIHPHIRLSNEGFIAGAYYNSEEAISPYLGWRFEHRQSYLEIGLVVGYKTEPVIPYARVGYDFNDNLNLFITPAYEQVNGGRVGAVVGLEIKF